MEGYPEYRNDSCYFEGECNFIRNLDTGNIWQIGTPEKPFLSEAYSPAYSLITDDSFPYPQNNNDYVEFAIPRSLGYYDHNLFIQFWQKHDFAILEDGGSIMLGFDNGPFKNIVNWGDFSDTSIVNLDFIGYRYDQESVFGLIDIGYTGNSEKWKYTEIVLYFEFFERLGRIRGYSTVDTARLRFYLHSDIIEGGEEGWSLDNFVFGGYYGSEINNLQLSLQLKTYPNPVADQLYIYAANSSNQKFELNIKNIMGEMVLQMPEIYSVDGNLNCNLSHLPSGIYVIELNNTEKKYSGKIVKQ